MKKVMNPAFLKRRVIQLMLLLAGNAIDAMGIALFILPAGFIVSGATGMGRILSYALGGTWNVSACVMLFNVLLFLLAWICMGKHMAASRKRCPSPNRWAISVLTCLIISTV